MSNSKMPSWYWERGLHDAKIISATIKETNWNPNYCLTLKISCHGAIFERDITEIRFLNFKILTAEFDISLLNGGWWLSDELSQKDNRFYLDLLFDTSECNNENVKLSFEQAEVVRRKNK